MSSQSPPPPVPVPPPFPEDTHYNYRGVSFDPQTRLWRARIYCLGRHVTLGRYTSANEAAFVHDRAAFFIHGEEAQTNYGIDAARRSNQREAPSSSWRIMNTLQSLADARKRQKLAAASGIAGLAGVQGVVGGGVAMPSPPSHELGMRRAVANFGAQYAEGLRPSDVVRLHDELHIPADDLARLIEDTAARQVAARDLQRRRSRAQQQRVVQVLVAMASRVTHHAHGD